MAKTISLRVDEEVLREVDAIVGPGRRRRSEAVRDALKLWVKERTMAEKVRRHREGYRCHPVTRDEFEPILRAQRWPK